MDWAQKNNTVRLERIVRDFQLLRLELLHARIYSTCVQIGCQSPVHFMTLPLDPEGWNRPRPYYWCDQHEPWERGGVGPKQPVHFDAIRQMRAKHNKEIIFRKLKIALGIPAGAAITEHFARDFFARLGEDGIEDCPGILGAGCGSEPDPCR